jgi:hypothetical protein
MNRVRQNGNFHISNDEIANGFTRCDAKIDVSLKAVFSPAVERRFVLSSVVSRRYRVLTATTGEV